jgi:hypothetical protein
LTHSLRRFLLAGECKEVTATGQRDALRAGIDAREWQVTHDDETDTDLLCPAKTNSMLFVTFCSGTLPTRRQLLCAAALRE